MSDPTPAGSTSSRTAAFAAFEEFSLTYDTACTPSLTRLSLDLYGDQLTLVTGPSGSGKSTLARVVAGFVPQLLRGEIEGSARVLGHDVESAPLHAISQSIGIVFDNPFDQLTAATRTVFDETAYALENEGLPRAEIVSRVREALDSVGLAEVAGNHPRRLSGGQSQRLAIACALAQRKPILVLDDPTSQLDPTGTAEVVSMVAKLREEHTTVVVVAQDLRHWLGIADRLVILDEGRLAADGSPAALLAEPGPLAAKVMIPRYVAIWAELRSRGIGSSDTAPLGTDQLVASLHASVRSGD
ncbi:MAG: ABC transporter ATP-binding protein [bacterium]|nr:ABC transporter ATP-binding protein [bacterium]MDE0287845.1 ABC transporter ATP-binding protein [bacterium]MDE0438335.1 ABC transporter ATP-binding protein [bacterium]